MKRVRTGSDRLLLGAFGLAVLVTLLLIMVPVADAISAVASSKRSKRGPVIS